MAAGTSEMKDTSVCTLPDCTSRMMVSSCAVALVLMPSALSPYFAEKASAISVILPVEL